MKKVIFFTNGITGFGGAERVLLEAATYFRQKNVKLVIVTFLLNEKVVEKYKNNIKFINLNITNYNEGHKYLYKLLCPSNIVSDTLHKNLRHLLYFKRIVKLRRLINKIEPDLIIGQSSLDCLYLYLSTKFTKYKYISYIHGSLFWLENDYLKYGLIHKTVFNKIRNSVIGHKEFVPKRAGLSIVKSLFFNLVAFLEYLAVRKAKAIIVLTKQIQWEVKKLYNKNAIIIRGCIDKQLLNYKPKLDIRKKYSLQNKTIILNIGRLDHRKRIDVLIKSFFNLSPKYKEIVLIIGGKGPDKERLERIINDDKYKAYKNRVIMRGFVPDNEYFDHLAGCDIFAFPSWTTSGIPTYEALALGKKIIWSSEAEEPVLTHPNVYVAEPNVEAFTKAIEKALNSKLYLKPDLREHTWERYFEKLYCLANNVVNKR